MKSRWPFVLLTMSWQVLPASLHAAQWHMIRIPGLADEYAYDLDSVYIFGDEITYWLRIRSAEGSAGPANSLIRQRAHCSEHLLTTLTRIDLDGNGRRLGVATPSHSEPGPEAGESTASHVIRNICRLIGRKRMDTGHGVWREGQHD